MNERELAGESNEAGGLVDSVYALRQAAIDHGLALAKLQASPSTIARDELLDTQITLEEKTAAAIEECGDAK